MTWVDFTVLGVMALSAVLAYARGFVREVLSIGAWIGAVIIASRTQAAGRDIAAQWIHDPQVASAASFVVLLLVSLIVLKLIARAIGAAIKGSMFGSIDRSLGMLFGLARGALLAIVAYMLGGMATSVDHWPPAVQDARCLPYLYQGAVWVRETFLPEEYRPRIYAPPGVQAPSADSLLRASPLGRAGQGK